MRNKAKIKTTIALIATFGVIGLIETVGATPDGSQRLRGLADRVFLVDVDTIIAGEVVEEFVNCYFFESALDINGNTIWFEAGGTPLGTWEQNSNGASTTYSVEADVPPSEAFPNGLTLIQNGHVSPANGRGVLQLMAISTIREFGDFPLSFISEGAEIDASHVADLCPPFD